MPGRSTGWITRAAGAGTVAALFGVGLGTLHYARLPGTAELPWCSLGPAVLGYAVFCGIAAGLGLGAGTAVAVRSAGGPHRVGMLRMVLGGIAGGLLGLVVPGIVGIAGFGSLDAPYAGTGNIVFCLLVASTAFVSLWAPVLWRTGAGRPIALVEHLGLSAIAASLAIASLGILGATLCTALDVVPSFDWLADTAIALGLVPFAMIASSILATILGAAMGFACWLYLSAAIVMERRLR
jgi:hypothetical protein